MVELILEYFDDETTLEQALVNANIEYQICLHCGDYGIKPPHLVVDGVPLDQKRSMKWVKERGKHE